MFPTEVALQIELPGLGLTAVVFLFSYVAELNGMEFQMLTQEY